MTNVLNPTSRPRRSLLKLAAAIAGVWLVVLLLAWLANPLIRKGLPSDMSDQRDYVLVPRSGLYQASAQRIGYGVGSPWLKSAAVKPQHGCFKLDAGDAANYSIDLTRGTSYSSITFSSGNTQAGVSVEGWMDRCGMDESNPELRAEVAELMVLIAAPDFDPANQPLLNHFAVTMTSTRLYYPTGQEGALLNSVWAVLGLVGTVLLVRRWRRRRVVAGFEIRPNASDPANLPPVDVWLQ